MKHNKLTSLFATIPLLIATSSYAADINFSGFANIAAGITTSSDETFDGYTSDIDFNEGSLFALQVSSDLGDGLGVTAQIIARGEDDFDPKFEWAYVSYEFNDNWKVLAGRQRAPFFMYSDFLDVSYAYNWITPPQGVYDLAFDSFDGLGVIYTSQLGEFDSTLHFSAGRNRDDFNLADPSEAENIVQPDFNKLVGVAWTLNRDWLTLRSAFFQTDMTLPVPALSGLVAGLDGFGFSQRSDNLEANEDKVTFAELGFQVDYNDFIVIGEFTTLDLSDTGFADSDAFYLSVAKRFDNITVHVTYGEKDSDIDNLLSDLPSTISTPIVNTGDPTADFITAATTDATYAAIYNGTAGYLASVEEEQSYITVGAKWDFHDAASLKFEVTKFEDDGADNTEATLLNIALVTVF